MRAPGVLRFLLCRPQMSRSKIRTNVGWDANSCGQFLGRIVRRLRVTSPLFCDFLAQLYVRSNSRYRHFFHLSPRQRILCLVLSDLGEPDVGEEEKREEECWWNVEPWHIKRCGRGNRARRERIRRAHRVTARPGVTLDLYSGCSLFQSRRTSLLYYIVSATLKLHRSVQVPVFRCSRDGDSFEVVLCIGGGYHRSL